MRYQSGGAFRQDLEDRLRSQSIAEGWPLVRLRKAVAFERFLARLMQDQPRSWLLKGGLALQWRLGLSARTTLDVDLLLVSAEKDVHAALVRAGLLDLGDWFRFLVQAPVDAVAPAAAGTRFAVQALCDDRSFERFHLDVGQGDPVVEEAEWLDAPPLLDFADVSPISVLCYPLSQHLAEKVHAYTLPRRAGDNSRVKDLVDMLLIAQSARLRGNTLRWALQATFEARDTHALPITLPDPPRSWAAFFREMSRSLGMGYQELAVAMQAVRAFLNPVLSNESVTEWDPTKWEWQ